MNNVHVINMGMVNVYLLKGNKYILVDTGTKESENKILKSINSIGVKPEDIELIILTHGHIDHIGSLSSLVEKTGAKVLMDKTEYATLTLEIEDEIKPIAPLVKFIFWIQKLRGIKSEKVELTIDYLIEEDFDLEPYGIKGKVVQTPGHTKGSISVLLDDGKTIIGDNLMAMMPWSKPSPPMLAYNIYKVRKSIEKLLKLGATKFYLSHGKIYDVSDIKKAIVKI